MSIIKSENDSVFNETSYKEVEEKFKDIICKDCHESRHANNNYFKCKFYKEEPANDVITARGKKRKQTNSVRQDKRAAKYQKISSGSSSVTCKSCKEPGHSSSRSFACVNHKPTKKESLSENLGLDYKAFMRKLPFRSVINEEYQDLLYQKVLATSKDLRHIIFRAIVFNKNYWYL